MRERTRRYTDRLPCIGLKFMAEMRQQLHDAEQGARIYSHTDSGTLYISRQDDGYAMTQAGYGNRYWYCCPSCNRRIAKLYIGVKDIACRHCWGLHYKSQSEDELARMRRDIRRQRYAIWGNTVVTRNLTNYPNTFPKPKGMRWETYNRKLAALIFSENVYWRAFSPLVDRLCGKVQR
ncbi:hypothetical protein ACEV60_21440 [Enterobacter ludwigii]|uniref:hypothetical protein n=1 Tax=Enterobacter TaxID=547 RepID=UPI003BEED491